ncbi:hypothetical protein G6L37_06725 [Agrobacterium rubi]|nr:hypothetical protein [Agrobacterium rubi]NTF25058.1 hypothetical protein [Agrobacterium rubi]
MKDMTYDRYEIRALKYSPKKSVTGDCFSLELWVDDEKFAVVHNDGREKQAHIDFVAPFTWDDGHKVAADMSDDSFLVPDQIEFNPLHAGVESLMRLAIAANDIIKGSKEKAMYVFAGQLMRLGYAQPETNPDQRLFDHVTTKFPGAVILNRMDPVEAAKLAIEAEREANPDMSGPRTLSMR